MPRLRFPIGAALALDTASLLKTFTVTAIGHFAPVDQSLKKTHVFPSRQKKKYRIDGLSFTWIANAKP